MTRNITTLMAGLFLVLAATTTSPAQTDGGAVSAGALTISAAWARATPTNAPVAGAYLTISNRGDKPDRLIAVATSASGTAEVHHMRMEGTVMVMRALPDGLPVAAGQTVTLAPGGNHLMLMGLTVPLVEGGRFKAALTFESAGKVEIFIPVVSMGAQGAPLTVDQADQMNEHDHHH